MQKHCAECKFVHTIQPCGCRMCILQDIMLKDEDYDDVEHCWLEDAQEHAEELHPEIWKEAKDACPHFKVECGRPTWMDDNELYMEIWSFQPGDVKSQNIIDWINE